MKKVAVIPVAIFACSNILYRIRPTGIKTQTWKTKTIKELVPYRFRILKPPPLSVLNQQGRHGKQNKNQKKHIEMNKYVCQYDFCVK